MNNRLMKMHPSNSKNSIVLQHCNYADVPYVHDSCYSRDGVSEILMIYHIRILVLMKHDACGSGTRVRTDLRTSSCDRKAASGLVPSHCYTAPNIGS